MFPGAILPAATGLFLKHLMAPLPLGHGRPWSKLTLCFKLTLRLCQAPIHTFWQTAQICESLIFQLIATGETVHAKIQKSAVLTKLWVCHLWYLEQLPWPYLWSPHLFMYDTDPVWHNLNLNPTETKVHEWVSSNSAFTRKQWLFKFFFILYGACLLPLFSFLFTFWYLLPVIRCFA